MGHELLRPRAAVDIADHGASYHHPGAGGQALADAHGDQPFYALRQGTAYGRGDIGQERSQNHRLASTGIRQRPVHQHHHTESDEIGAQGLLHLQGAGVQLAGNI